jgi:transcription elongation factor GreB
MSRAFVDESAQEPREEEVPELKILLPPGAKNYMTPKGAERLRVELAELQRERPRLIAAIGKIEGSERDVRGEQRRRMRETDRRIEYLQRMHSILEVIDPAQQSSDRVVFGATVTVRESGGREKTYQIVGVDEADPEKGRVSWISPIARALISKRVGDTAALKLPTGETRLTITGLRYA